MCTREGHCEHSSNQHEHDGGNVAKLCKNLLSGSFEKAAGSVVWSRSDRTLVEYPAWMFLERMSQQKITAETSL